MSKSEELVKRLKWWAVESCGGQLEADLNAAIAALSAQPQQEPVAHGAENYSCPSCGKNYTAPPSGAREGMLRAERDAYKKAYEYLQGRMESLDRHGWAHDADGDIEYAITRAAAGQCRGEENEEV